MSVFFFFSSRRRHTRFDCDWSSDVCSSDLTSFAVTRRTGASRWRNAPSMIDAAISAAGPKLRGASWTTTRSEEHTSELQSQSNLVCRLLLEKKKHVMLQV